MTEKKSQETDDVKLNIAKPKSERNFKLMIFKNHEDKLDPVPVVVNGYPFYIKRGIEVVVPECVVEVLRHANITKYRQVKNPDTSPDASDFILQEEVAPAFTFNAEPI